MVDSLWIRHLKAILAKRLITEGRRRRRLSPENAAYVILRCAFPIADALACGVYYYRRWSGIDGCHRYEATTVKAHAIDDLRIYHELLDQWTSWRKP